MNTNSTSITRRQALQTVAATALGAGLAGRLAAQDPQAAKPAPSLLKPTLHVYDTRRDRYDGNGINGQGFHPFFTKEGKLRGGLDFLTEQPNLRAPWEKT